MSLTNIDPARIDRAIPRQRNGLRNCPGIDGCRREGFLSLFRLDTHLRQSHSTNVEEFLEAFERRAPAPPRMPAAPPPQGREGRPHVVKRSGKTGPEAPKPPPAAEPEDHDVTTAGAPPHGAEDRPHDVKPRAPLEDLAFEASEESLDLEPEDHDAEASPQGVSGAEEPEPSKRSDETMLEYVRRVLPYLRSRDPEIDWRVCEEPDCPAPGPIRGPRGLGGHRSKYHPRPRAAVEPLDLGALDRVSARLRATKEEEPMPGNEPQVGAPNGAAATGHEVEALPPDVLARFREIERQAEANARAAPPMRVLEAKMVPPFDRMLERYFEVLLEKAFEATEPDAALLDRIEAILLPAPGEIIVEEASDGR